MASVTAHVPLHACITGQDVAETRKQSVVVLTTHSMEEAEATDADGFLKILRVFH